MFFLYNLHSIHTELKKNGRCCMQNNHSQPKSPVELKDNSNMQCEKFGLRKMSLPAVYHLPEEDVVAREGGDVGCTCVISKLQWCPFQKLTCLVCYSLELFFVGFVSVDAEDDILASYKLKDWQRFPEPLHLEDITKAVPVQAWWIQRIHQSFHQHQDIYLRVS